MDIVDYLLYTNPQYKALLNKSKGYCGELITTLILSNIKGYNKIIKNAYIPYNGKYAEIDIIFIHETGIYIFECKEFKGSIYGKDNIMHWTQYSYGKKYKFYNPIMQNRTHIKAIRQYINDVNNIYSYIVFGDKSNLKISKTSNDYTLTYTRYLFQIMQSDINSRDICYTHEQIDNIHNIINNLHK